MSLAVPYENREQINLAEEFADLVSEVEYTWTAIVKVNCKAGRVGCELLTLIPVGLNRESIDPLFSGLSKKVETRVRQLVTELLQD